MRSLASKIILNLCVICLSIFVVGGAFAQPAPSPREPGIPDSCDQDFYNVMEARSLLEATREMEVAETLILRPDSVLEYSCFNVRLDETGRAADLMFSDNVTSTALFRQPPEEFNRNKSISATAPEVSTVRLDPGRGLDLLGQTRVEFGPQPPGGITNTSLDTALSNLVLSSLAEFVGRNFGHVFAGGTFFGTPRGGGQPCSAMDLVWSFLKCRNIEKNNFYRFRELLIVDPRLNPVACNDPSRGAFYGVNIAATEPLPDGLGGVESVGPHMNLDLFDVNQCAASAPIFTGTLVYPFPPAGQQPHDDAFCVTPGCYYDRQSQQCREG